MHIARPLTAAFIFFVHLSIANASSGGICSAETQDRLFYPPPNEEAIDCSYYLYRELNQPCGANGYFIGFAYKYCDVYLFGKRRFLDFSDFAYKWMTQVGLCLQRELHQESCRRVSAGRVDLSCREAHDFAMQSHPGCYLRPNPAEPEVSVCNLSVSDYIAIVNVIKNTFMLPEVWQQMVEVGKGCKDQPFRALFGDEGLFSAR